MQIRDLIPLPWVNKIERIFPSIEREITALRAYGRVSLDTSVQPNDAHPFCCRTIEIPEKQGAIWNQVRRVKPWELSYAGMVPPLSISALDTTAK